MANNTTRTMPCTNAASNCMGTPCHLNCSTAQDANSTNILIFMEKPDTLQGLVFLVGNILSMTGLILTLLVHYYLRKQLWTLKGHCLVSLASSLLLAKLAFQVNPYFNAHANLCSAVAILQHYFCLAAFCWLSVLVFNIWKASIHHEPTGKRMKRFWCSYMAFAWGAPLVVVVLCIFLEYMLYQGQKYGNVRYCGVLGDDLLLYSLAIPLIILTCINIILFIIVTYKRVVRARKNPPLYTTQTPKGCFKRSNTLDPKVQGHCLVAYAKTCALMTSAWIMGFLASNNAHFCTHWFCDWWIFFIILNCLQGIFIFINFCLTKDVISELKAKYAEFLVKVKVANKKRRLAKNSLKIETMERKYGTDSGPTGIATVSEGITDTSQI